MGSFTSGFSGGATVEYSNIVQYATGGGAVFGLGETTGNDYQAKAEFGEAHFLDSPAHNSLYSISISQQVSRETPQDRWFLHSIRRHRWWCCFQHGCLVSLRKHSRCRGTPLLALNLEKDTVSVGSTSGLANEGFFSIVSQLEISIELCSSLDRGQWFYFEIRHGLATTNLDAREPTPAQPSILGNSNTVTNNTSIQGFNSRRARC